VFFFSFSQYAKSAAAPEAQADLPPPARPESTFDRGRSRRVPRTRNGLSSRPWDSSTLFPIRPLPPPPVTSPGRWLSLSPQDSSKLQTLSRLLYIYSIYRSRMLTAILTPIYTWHRPQIRDYIYVYILSRQPRTYSPIHIC